MVLVFFVYGLAFFSMGFAIALESRQSSGLRLAASLPFLAAFGILHGLVEWADMLLLVESASPPTFDMEAVRLIRTILLGVSTGALLQFGANLLANSSGKATAKPPGSLARTPAAGHAVRPDPTVFTLASVSPRVRWLRLLPAALGLLWVASLALLATLYPLGTRQWLIHADIWGRYLLYLPGSVLAGFGLMAEARLLEKSDFRPMARDARFAAATLLLNALVAGLVVPPGQRFPAVPLNYDSFQALFGMPVQVIRTVSAIAIAYFVLRVLRVFRFQSARQMEEANRRQIEAQREALEAQQRAQEQMEQWNRELEERIARRTVEITLRNKQLTALNSIAASVSQSFDLQRILAETLDRTLEALEADGGGIFLSGEAGEPTIHLARGLPEDFTATVSRTRLDAVMVAELANEGQGNAGTGRRGDGETGRQGDGESGERGTTPEHPAPSTQHSVLSPQSSVLSPQSSPPAVRSFLTAPLKAKGRVVGVIAVARWKDPRFGPEDGRLMTAIGHQVGVAVENARLFAQVQRMAVLAERERLAREMHDGLAQVIGFLSVKTRVVQQLVARGKLEQAESDLDQMQRIVQDAYADVRQSILSLRVATELEQGLVAAIRTSAGDFSEQNSIPVELALAEEGEVSFPPEAEVQLVRIVQEALANVRKHARAGKVWIRLERHDGETLLAVEDDGVGFDRSEVAARKRRSFGLETMKERAESIGARLEVVSIPGEGTRIQVRYPSEQHTAEPRRVFESPAG